MTKHLYIATLLFLLYTSLGFYLLNRFDANKAEIKKQTAIIRAETERKNAEIEGNIAILNAQTELEKVKVRSDPDVAESIKRAEKTKVWLAAWLPVWLPFALSGASSVLLATYISFRIVDFSFDGLQTQVRALDVLRLSQNCLQVKALEATQGVNVVQLADQMQRQNMTALGSFARGMRGLIGVGSKSPILDSHALPAASPMMSAQPVPTFQQARQDMKPGHVLLGYERDNKPVHFPINQFVSCALAGGSGSGKTTKERFFVAQMAVNGVRVHILDAHAGDEQSLVNSLGEICQLPNVTTYSPIDTRDTIHFFLSDLEEAKKHPEQKETTIYVIDELLPIIDAVPETSNFILKVATEGRKYERFGMISGQVWPASLFGKGSSVRDALMLKMSAKLPLEQARILFKSKEKAQTVERLQLSEMYASSMNFQGVVNVPFCSRDDMNTLARTQKPIDSSATQSEEMNDTELISKIKTRYPQNNELARLINRDKGQVSSVLNNPEKMTPSMRSAFLQLLQTA